jgi:serine/threonine protein phosphatase PrpC
MIKSVEYVYEKGSNAKNEDAYIVDENRKIFGAIDGATGLGALTGEIASQIIKKSIEKSTFPEIYEMIQEANHNLQIDTEALTGKALASIPKFERSTCGIAAIQLVNNHLNYIAAGDCMLFLEYTNGRVRTLTYDHLDALDSNSISAFYHLLNEEARTLGVELNTLNSSEIDSIYKKGREKITPLLKENRNKLNTTGGYGIIDGSEEALSFLEYGTIPLINVKRILLLTDGLKMHTENNGWQESAELAFKKGVQELFASIQRKEENDPACFLYPRLKKHDDKTGILITLDN